MDALYHDYLFLALFILLLGFAMGTIQSRKQHQFYFVLFIFSSLISGSYFTDPDQVGNSALALLHPWTLPFLYTIGPALLHSYNYDKDSVNHVKTLFHYLPAITISALLLAHYFLSPNSYKESYALALDFKLDITKTTRFINDSTLFLLYPIHVMSYAVYILLTKRKLHWRELSLPICILLFLFPLFELILHFIYGHSLIFKSPQLLRVLLIFPVFAIIFDMFLGRKLLASTRTPSAIRPSKPTGNDPSPAANTATSSLKVLLYLEAQIDDQESLFFNEGVHKDVILQQSPFELEEWKLFFQEQHKNFTYYKKWVRVHKAIKLIEGDYLDQYGVQALCSEVGYSSRSSFYLAFEEITGKRLSEYRSTPANDV